MSPSRTTRVGPARWREVAVEADHPDMVMQAANIARILANTDVSHLIKSLENGTLSDLVQTLSIACLHGDDEILLVTEVQVVSPRISGLFASLSVRNKVLVWSSVDVKKKVHVLSI
ncbi:unnamed protein product [Urochloa humidicola]